MITTAASDPDARSCLGFRVHQFPAARHQAENASIRATVQGLETLLPVETTSAAETFVLHHGSKRIPNASFIINYQNWSIYVRYAFLHRAIRLSVMFRLQRAFFLESTTS